MEIDTPVLDDWRGASPPPKPCPPPPGPMGSLWGPRWPGLAARSSARRPAWILQCRGPGVWGGAESATQRGRGSLLPETPELPGDSGPQRSAPATCPLTRIEAGIKGSPLGQKEASGSLDGLERFRILIQACRACPAPPNPSPTAGGRGRTTVAGEPGHSHHQSLRRGGGNEGPASCREGWTSSAPCHPGWGRASRPSGARPSVGCRLPLEGLLDVRSGQALHPYSPRKFVEYLSDIQG